MVNWPLITVPLPTKLPSSQITSPFNVAFVETLTWFFIWQPCSISALVLITQLSPTEHPWLRIASFPIKLPSPMVDALETNADLSMTFMRDRFLSFNLSNHAFRLALFPLLSSFLCTSLMLRKFSYKILSLPQQIFLYLIFLNPKILIYQQIVHL